jgi:hypothetical protein
MKTKQLLEIIMIVAFFALLPALIIMEVKVLRLIPDFAYIFIIADVLLGGFILLEIGIFIYRFQKDKKSKALEEKEDSKDEGIKISKAWEKSEDEESERE